jgi:hypothetical protein
MTTELAIPDFEEMILDRLSVCVKEIEGVKTVYRQPPATQPEVGALPMAYALVGPMLEPVPIVTASAMIVKRNYVIVLLVEPYSSTSDEQDDNSGAVFVTAPVPFFARFRSYFALHPRLETAEHRGLEHMHKDVLFRDDGIQPIPGPGGSYAGQRFTITTEMRATIRRR